ncbi:hypothetical protein [Lysobacter gummosus]|uniref:hypothetical protein n=1 Tax=Lysobacter gummosus TaxID=262324 RepID=UPI00363148B6
MRSVCDVLISTSRATVAERPERGGAGWRIWVQHAAIGAAGISVIGPARDARTGGSGCGFHPSGWAGKAACRDRFVPAGRGGCIASPRVGHRPFPHHCEQLRTPAIRAVATIWLSSPRYSDWPPNPDKRILSNPDTNLI